MKKTIQLLIFLGLATISTGCASPYMIDRGCDAADIVTLTAGVGGGATARVGPLHFGLFYGEDLVGIRHGDLEYISPSESFTLQALGMPCRHHRLWGACVDILGFGQDLFLPNASAERCRKVSISTEGGLPLLFVDDPEDLAQRYYYTQIEACVGFGPTLRLGFNPGELLDFVLGWTTLDIFNDDLEEKKESNKALQAPSL